MQDRAMTVTTREWELAARPHGEPTPDDFRLVEREHPDPGEGQVVVRLLVMSVDPYMRGRMRSGPSYAAPWEIGETMRGGAVGRVVESRSPAVPVGSLVLTDAAWRDLAVLDAAHVRVLPELPGIPPSYHLGVLGMPGLTAWAGLFRIAGFRPGEAVFVSGAAGAVGSLVGQFALLDGASAVIGSAGTPEKVDWLTAELGFTAAFDYHEGPVAELLADAAPQGIDVFFDNVGGEILDAVLARIQRKARIVICGAISQYNNTTPVQGPKNYLSLLVNRARMEGMVVFDYADRYPVAVAELAGYLKDGRMKSKEDVVEGGVAAFPETLNRLFRGENFGKLVLQVASE
jgi:NADPH-dependent curcumin reductase CurA